MSNKHLSNLLRLWYPFFWTAMASTVWTSIGFAMRDYAPDYAGTWIASGVLSAFALFPLAFYCAARSVEYDRLVNELVRSGAKSINNPRVDKLVNRFFATRGRQLVCALGMTTLQHGPSKEDALDWVKSVHDGRKKRLKKATLLTNDWWEATFVPANLQ